MTASQPGDIFQPGDLLNNTYRIELILGRGGTSEVYKARSEISGRVMAVKALRAEFASNEDFLVLMTREEDIRDVHHDAIVRYFDTQRMPDGVVYLVMDYVDGPGLEKKLAEGGMPASELLVVGARVCKGLIAAHNRNIVHRDLSPDNIILRNDVPDEAVIIDFGIAKDTNPGAETIVGNEFAGKYAYAAPEQLSGKTDQRSDIYSLGALLLSTFRGQKPDMGRNPMEVIEKKKQPLDLEGVPEPLRSLIAKMSDPDPERRFATAEDLLAAFENPALIVADMAAAAAEPEAELDDATVIASPPAARPPDPSPVALGIPDSRPKPAAPPEKKGKGGLIGLLALVLLVVLGAGGYFAGLFDQFMGPRYPVADPYTLIVQKKSDGDVLAVGNVPSPETLDGISARVRDMGGSAELTLASGDISEGWSDGVAQIIDRATVLDEFRVAIQNDQLRLSGLAPDRNALSSIEAAFANGFPGGLTGSVDLELGPRFLTAAMLSPVLESHADCGRLQLLSPPPIGYALEDQIIITGRFGSAANRDALYNAVAGLAGNRPVRIEAEVLNASLCLIDSALPRAGPGGFEPRLGFGDRAGENISGHYKVGDNPVIDIRLPEGSDDGFIWASVIDVKGVVYHLLPNLNRPDNSIASLRNETTDGYLRVAYGLNEAQGSGKIAFTVDGSILGKSKVLVLTSDRPLFPDLRPTTESAESYAEALIEASDSGSVTVRSLDSAILTTRQ